MTSHKRRGLMPAHKRGLMTSLKRGVYKFHGWAWIPAEVETVCTCDICNAGVEENEMDKR